MKNDVSGLLGECALPVTGRRDVCDELCVVETDSDSVKFASVFQAASLSSTALNSPQNQLKASSISAKPGGRPQADLDPMQRHLQRRALRTTVLV